MMRRLELFVACWFVANTAACGAGIPITVRIDQFTTSFSVDDFIDDAEAELLTQGVLPAGTTGIPEIWPEILPDVKYQSLYTTAPIEINLNEERYDDINRAEAAIKRIEINRFIVRMESSTLSISLPQLSIQAADDRNADPDDRQAWRPIGTIPATPTQGFVGDQDFVFSPGGEVFLFDQFMDDEKELALRVQGLLEIDTAINPLRPSGEASVRVITELTFFVDPSELL